jgi:Protein of unknown function (DUF3309)
LYRLILANRSNLISISFAIRGNKAMSLGTILLIILVIALLGGFSGFGGGPFYGTGYYGGGGLGLVIVIILILVLLGKL